MSQIIGGLAKLIAYPMEWIYNFVGNYAIAIILLTVLIRILMIPLFAKQMKTQAKMAALQPKIQEIQAKYAKDRATMNEKMSEVYSESGVNQLDGCLPMLIQMPFIFGLYELLRNPITYMQTSNMMAAVHESFIWVKDLSQPDGWILPILAGITTYLSTAASTANADASTAGAMNSMKYFMPVMILLLGRSMPAGLAIYWTVGNLVMMIQNLIFNNKNKKEKLKREVEAEVMKKAKKAEK